MVMFSSLISCNGRSEAPAAPNKLLRVRTYACHPPAQHQAGLYNISNRKACQPRVHISTYWDLLHLV